MNSCSQKSAQSSGLKTSLSLLGVALLMQPRNILVDCINVHIHVYNVYIDFIDQENPQVPFPGGESPVRIDASGCCTPELCFP